MKKSSNLYKLALVLLTLHQIWVKLYLTYLFIEKNVHVLYDDFRKSQFGGQDNRR